MAKRQVTMLVTVSCPDWLSSEEARKEVRYRLNTGAYFGHVDAFRSKEKISSSNLKLLKIKSA